MNLKKALSVIRKHARTVSKGSLNSLILKTHLDQKASLTEVARIKKELLEALFSINHARLTRGYVVTQLPLVLDITAILASGWDEYVWWSTQNHISKAALAGWSDFLSDFGFAWTRILDGTTSDLKNALKERRIL